MNMHKCDDDCKVRSKSSLTCYICNGSFSIKCFKIDSGTFNKINCVNSHIKFVCGHCQIKNRKSVSTQSQNALSNDTNQINKNFKLIIDKLSLLTPGNIINPNPSTSTDNNTQNPSTATDNTNHAETQTDKVNKSLTNTIDNVYQLLLKATDKLEKVHTSSESIEAVIQNLSTETSKISACMPDIAKTDKLQEIASNLCKCIDSKLNTSKTASTTSELIKKHMMSRNDSNLNSLDWSMGNDSLNLADNVDGRPSIIVRQSIDDSVIDVMKNSDQTTWDTLDIIYKKLKDNAENINQIANKVDKIASNTAEPQISNEMRSPLVETVLHETIDNLATRFEDLNVLLSNNQLNLQNLHLLMNNLNDAFNDKQRATIDIDHALDNTEIFPNSILIDELAVNSGNSSNIEDNLPQNNKKNLPTNVTSTNATHDSSTNSSSTNHQSLNSKKNHKHSNSKLNRHFYVSKFHNETTIEDIIEYMVNRGSIDSNLIRVSPH